MQKKYYSISEVSSKLNIPDYTIRYFEKSNPNFKVKKLRNRRYYTIEDIEIIRESISLGNPLYIISRIDNLISKFKLLSKYVTFTIRI